MLRTLFNPFTKIAGFPALFLGWFVMLLTAAVAAPCGVNFVGSLNIHVGRPTPFGIIFALLIAGWLIASVCFLIAGKMGSSSKIRAVDIFGTLALARAPFLIAAPLGLLPGLQNLDPQMFLHWEKITPEILTSLAVATVMFLLIDIWVVILSYNAFAVSANVKSKGLFAAVLIVSEIIAVGSSSAFLALSALGMPVSEAAIASIDRLEPPNPNEAQRVALAKSVLKRIVQGEYDSIPNDFNDTMKKALSPWGIRKAWLECLALGGKFESAESPVTTDTAGQFRRVLIPIRFERNDAMVFLLVFDSAGKITGMFINNSPPPKNPQAANQPVEAVKLEAPAPEDAEQVEIAKRFVERILSDSPNDPLREFQATEGMKKYVTSDSFKEWAKQIVNDYGKPGEYEKIDVVRHDGARRSVYLFFHCERYPIKMWVTFDGKTIDGFHWDSWKEDAGKNDVGFNGLVSMVVGSALIVPVLLILIIYFGEKWRHKADGPLDGLENIGSEFYRETQNPLWAYLLTFVAVMPLIPALCLVWVVGEGPGFWISLAIFAFAGGLLLLLPIFCCRFRFEVDDRYVRVRMGLLGIPVFWLPFDSIASVETMKFNPLMDFGGYGIRYGKGMTAYYMTGNQGVLLTSQAGKKYLLGSDTPDRLATVIRSRLPESK